MRVRITEQLFDDIKYDMRYRRLSKIMSVHNIGYKTAIQIDASKDFATYTAQNKAQHPVTLYSLADNVIELHNIIFNQHDNTYIVPKTAKQAIKEIQQHHIKQRREADNAGIHKAR